ncbi:MAG TPA: tRNA preQ1(34) S-adenosylmethionine ribosyltransferase-isomerase QueA [Thermoanaerobaculia bacterium]|nr:tRNA preQ1(34) S-adenosylmethionine ribosyltransferase-isomerase QueA [Thermoanaerobaculia bacterium]
MLTSDFDYDLPPERIAQRPAPRGSARLLVLDAQGAARHGRFDALPQLVREGDLLVLNDTRVLAARLRARVCDAAGVAGAAVELLLLEPAGDGSWWALARPGKRLRPGRRLRLESTGGATLEAEITARERERFRIAFARPILQELERFGSVPLPPYVRRPADDADRVDYQTVYARAPGAVAAPTAGLHFTAEMLARLEAVGVDRATLTLHVGPGTFRPVQTEDPAEHAMHAERFEIPVATADAIAAARQRGGRVIAVGTTVVRALESAWGGEAVAPGAGLTELFVTPGFRFAVVDALVTNFHLPRSTLLMLVCAFAGTQRVLAAYRDAVASGYRFYSYGDAMFAERASDETIRAASVAAP